MMMVMGDSVMDWIIGKPCWSYRGCVLLRERMSRLSGFTGMDFA